MGILLSSMNKSIQDYEKACNAVLDEFQKKYYPDDETFYWIGGEVGDVVSIGDEFYNLQLMVNILRFNLTDEQNTEYYDYCLDLCEKEKSPLSLEKWLEK